MLRSSAPSPLRAVFFTLFLSMLLVLATGCAEKTPAEKVAEARAAYVVELNSWFPREPEPEPVADEAAVEGAAEDGDAADGDAADGDAADGEAAEGDDTAAEGEATDGELEVLDVDADTGPRQVTVFFDLIVLFEGDEPLGGLTLDVSQADGAGAEKKSWLHYVELPDHIKGSTKQVSFETPGVEFEEGDQFSVILRKVVPPDEQGDYREFASAGS
ncbi:MAG: hypothetical protein AAFX50_05220 [Acidobacteriota bacterium]